MHQENIQYWQHSHGFGQDRKHGGEQRTVIVVLITAAMMIVEIVAGIIFGSMALLADGLHMASHAAALGINVFAYAYARRHAFDKSFSFGTGKVNALGGFTGAVLLGIFALIMAWESFLRILNPVAIAFNQAIFVAMVGLVVNGFSAMILDVKKASHSHGSETHSHHHDHNLRSAYLHVMADAVTSVLAIFALLAAKFFGVIWMDPLMGIVGAVLVTRWSWGLLQVTSHVLLDKQSSSEIREKIKVIIEQGGDSRVADLHLWAVGPNIYGTIISVVARHPLEPEAYKRLIPSHLGLVHIAVEVHKCKEAELHPIVKGEK